VPPPPARASDTLVQASAALQRCAVRVFVRGKGTGELKSQRGIWWRLAFMVRQSGPFEPATLKVSSSDAEHHTRRGFDCELRASSAYAPGDCGPSLRRGPVLEQCLRTGAPSTPCARRQAREGSGAVTFQCYRHLVLRVAQAVDPRRTTTRIVAAPAFSQGQDRPRTTLARSPGDLPIDPPIPDLRRNQGQ